MLRTKAQVEIEVYNPPAEIVIVSFHDKKLDRYFEVNFTLEEAEALAGTLRIHVEQALGEKKIGMLP